MSHPSVPPKCPIVPNRELRLVPRCEFPSRVAVVDLVDCVAVTLAEMLELEVLPEHGLCSDQIEFILGE